MRLGIIPHTLLERLILATNSAPTPLVDTTVGLLMARTLMAATSLGVFEALADGPLSAPQVAERCSTDPQATARLLDALTGCAYVRASAQGYALAPVARRWMLKGQPDSVHDAIVHRYLDLDFMGHMEDYVRSGQPLDFHRHMSPAQWDVYQRGQRAHAVFMAGEVVRRLPVPRRARALLDIGGAHGYYATALCRRHRHLRATILDLPEAVAASAPILSAAGLGERVRHQSGDALTSDLGEATYDVVLIANLVHHFDLATNAALATRVARALRPGGCYAVLDVLRPVTSRAGGQVGTLTNLYFAITSKGGTYTADEMAEWQSAAGLLPRRPITLRFAPGYGIQVGIKQRR